MTTRIARTLDGSVYTFTEPDSLDRPFPPLHSGDTLHIDEQRQQTVTHAGEPTGRKDDGGKPRLDMVLGDFARALLAVGEVGTAGAARYADGNWLLVPNAYQRYSDAMQRHYLEGKITEKDVSGFLHDAHTAWNALARLELRLRGL